MAQQTHVPPGAHHSRMPLQRLGVTDVVQVGADDHGSVERDLHPAAQERDLLPVPFSHRRQRAAAGGNQAVDRSMRLPGLDPGVLGRRVVQNLDLHPVDGSVSVDGSPDTHAVVSSRSQLELETEDEVRVFLLRQELGPLPFGTDQEAIPDQPALIPLPDRPPSGQVPAVEKGDEARLRLSTVQRRGSRNGRQQGQQYGNQSRLQSATYDISTQTAPRPLDSTAFSMNSSPRRPS